MSKRQFILGMLFSSLLGGLIVLVGLSFMDDGSQNSNGFYNSNNLPRTTSFNDIPTEAKKYIVPEGINFVKASSEVVPAVVHITNSQVSSGKYGRLFRRGDRGVRQSTGSGVIISEDGYIVTNNHVVENADQLEVRLDDNRRIQAELIGTDPDTDLALIKVDAGSLPYVDFGDSDQVDIGEWVLAVGNPFDLNNTVTAGIVSAKARNINLIRSGGNEYGIESFIQTDAVVNRGNSGGALVNLEGQLIGINTAIATNTGTFNGYSFAVPSILVKKVMDDLLEFGVVQRGLLGVRIRDAGGLDTEELTGVFVSSVNAGGAADVAGLKSQDVIIGVGEREIKTTSQLQEMIARYRPGDDVLVKYKRDGKLKETTLTLKNMANSIAVVEKELLPSFEIEGAKFQDIDETVLRRMGIRGGAKLVELGNGAWSKSRVKENFIITKIGEESVRNIAELQKILETKDKDFYVLGKYPNGEKEYYRIDW
jgi:serine protease Do